MFDFAEFAGLFCHQAPLRTLEYVAPMGVWTW